MHLALVPAWQRLVQKAMGVENAMLSVRNAAVLSATENIKVSILKTDYNLLS